MCRYVDFALGDTAAMAGHSPAPTAEAVYRRLATDGGITTMMPTEDAEWVGAELTRRFGGAGASPVCLWSFTLTATDANRWAIRLARLATGRPKILVFAWCYHGSVDEIFAVPGPDGKAVMRPGNVAPPVDVALTTRVCEFNDVEGLKRELAHGDVAAVLMEPAMTNIGEPVSQPASQPHAAMPPPLLLGGVTLVSSTRPRPPQLASPSRSHPCLPLPSSLRAQAWCSLSPASWRSCGRSATRRARSS